VRNLHCGELPVSRRIFFDLISLSKVGRMMMNIRGLIMDDPQHTVYLHNLEFVKESESESTAVMELGSVRNDNVASV
jgi:hypothetical protein